MIGELSIVFAIGPGSGYSSAVLSRHRWHRIHSRNGNFSARLVSAPSSRCCLLSSSVRQKADLNHNFPLFFSFCAMCGECGASRVGHVHLWVTCWATMHVEQRGFTRDYLWAQVGLNNLKNTAYLNVIIQVGTPRSPTPFFLPTRLQAARSRRLPTVN